AFSLDLKDEQLYIRPEKIISGSLGKGLSGAIFGFVGRLPIVQVGKFSIENSVVAFPIYEDGNIRTIMTENNGSVGGELLKRFHVVIDYAEGEVYLKKNRQFKKPYEYDMSGMEIYVLHEEEEDDRFFISYIEEGTPADLEGFLVGD